MHNIGNSRTLPRNGESTIKGIQIIAGMRRWRVGCIAFAGNNSTTQYSQHPHNPYPSVDDPGYGLWGVMGSGRKVKKRFKNFSENHKKPLKILGTIICHQNMQLAGQSNDYTLFYNSQSKK
jgi:hypothetical protein